jgi:hypothetical protein
MLSTSKTLQFLTRNPKSLFQNRNFSSALTNLKYVFSDFSSLRGGYSLVSCSIDHVRMKNDQKSRRTKIVCTLGPSCWSVEGLTNLIDSGMNVARFNFSHGDHDSHYATLTRLREALSKRPGSHVAVMLDTKGFFFQLLSRLSFVIVLLTLLFLMLPSCSILSSALALRHLLCFSFSLSAVVFLCLCVGPEIRTGFVDPSLPGGKVKYTRGDIIEVGTDYSKPCTSSYLPCSYQSLPKSAKVGNRILIADGSMSIRVKEIKETSILAEVLNNATLGSKVRV